MLIKEYNLNLINQIKLNGNMNIKKQARIAIENFKNKSITKKHLNLYLKAEKLSISEPEKFKIALADIDNFNNELLTRKLKVLGFDGLTEIELKDQYDDIQQYIDDNKTELIALIQKSVKLSSIDVLNIKVKNYKIQLKKLKVENANKLATQFNKDSSDHYSFAFQSEKVASDESIYNSSSSQKYFIDYYLIFWLVLYASIYTCIYVYLNDKINIIYAIALNYYVYRRLVPKYTILKFI